MSMSLRKNFNALLKAGIPITPLKLNLFHISPLWMLNFALRLVFRSKFAEIFISSHAQNAKGEMELLGKEFHKIFNR